MKMTEFLSRLSDFECVQLDLASDPIRFSFMDGTEIPINLIRAVIGTNRRRIVFKLTENSPQIFGFWQLRLNDGRKDA